MLGAISQQLVAARWLELHLTELDSVILLDLEVKQQNLVRADDDQDLVSNEEQVVHAFINKLLLLCDLRILRVDDDRLAMAEEDEVQVSN